ncbi:hypothetical protein ACFQY0_11970 [Haloferula chungangensis]|uniref:Uncharacterized protein n=1 Tax=Haloferula chungangensis TaxID=1048331 RepID=A0ABW2L8C6_9BACT
MHYPDILNPSKLARHARRPFHHSMVDDIRHSVSRIELSTASLVAITAAASIGTGLALYFLSKRERDLECQASERPENPRLHT